jgi:hypothetical protein
MSKKLPQPEPKGFRPDPHRQHPPIDRKIQLPEPVRRAAARADALLTGKPFERAPQRNRTFSYSDTEIVEAMQYLDREGLQAGDPRVATIIALAREGAQHIKARRRGAHEPRENSENVTQRLGALLQAYRELSPNLQKRPTGATTIRFLRTAMVQKLGKKDTDHTISEDTIRQDIRLVRPYMRLIQQGIIPRTGSPKGQKEISEKTKQEMEAGKKAVAAAESGKKAQVRPSPRSKAAPKTKMRNS